MLRPCTLTLRVFLLRGLLPESPRIPPVETLAILAKLVTTHVPMMTEYSDMRLRHEEEDGCLRVALLGLGADLLEFTIKELQ